MGNLIYSQKYLTSMTVLKYVTSLKKSRDLNYYFGFFFFDLSDRKKKKKDLMYYHTHAKFHSLGLTSSGVVIGRGLLPKPRVILYKKSPGW